MLQRRANATLRDVRGQAGQLFDEGASGLALLDGEAAQQIFAPAGHGVDELPMAAIVGAADQQHVPERPGAGPVEAPQGDGGEHTVGGRRDKHHGHAIALRDELRRRRWDALNSGDGYRSGVPIKVELLDEQGTERLDALGARRREEVPDSLVNVRILSGNLSCH